MLDKYLGPDSWLINKIAEKGFTDKTRRKVYNKIASLLKNGTQLIIVLDVLKERAEKKGKTEVEAIVLGNVVKQVKSGKNFAESLQKYVPMGEMMLIQAGEKAGTLVEALELSSEMIINTQKIRKTIISALTQPLMSIGMLAAALIIISKVVVPKLALVLAPSKWHGVAHYFYLAMEMVNSYWALFVAIFFIVIGIVIILSLKRWSQHGRSKFDKIPPWSFYRILIGGGWLIALSALMKSGVAMIEAMNQLFQTAKKDNNKWFMHRLKATIINLNSGQNLGQALNATQLGFPDNEIIEDLIIYADLPNFDETLYNVSKEWVEEDILLIEQQAKILQTAVLLLFGVCIGVFAYSIITIQIQVGNMFSGMA